MTTTRAQLLPVFDRKINFWGRLTVGIGMLISIGAPVTLMLIYDLWPGLDVLLISFLALAALMAISWIVEPLTYFPMLGVAGTYQAWLVGNISNKLLPAAVIAQGTLDIRPGTRKGELVAIAAISGAVIVHVISLVIFVGIGGTFLSNFMPERLLAAFDYILPAILGAVIVQLVITVRNAVIPAVGLGAALLVALVLVPLVPALGGFAILLTVALTAVVSMLILRKSSKFAAASAEVKEDVA